MPTDESASPCTYSSMKVAKGAVSASGNDTEYCSVSTLITFRQWKVPEGEIDNKRQRILQRLLWRLSLNLLCIFMDPKA